MKTQTQTNTKPHLYFPIKIKSFCLLDHTKAYSLIYKINNTRLSTNFIKYRVNKLSNTSLLWEEYNEDESIFRIRYFS